MNARTGVAGDYFRAVESFDLRAANDLVVGLLEEGTPMDRIITEVIAPAQARVGQLWESGVWSVADENVATSISEGSLSALTYAASTPGRGTPTHHVAVACAEGEWHSLPARMAAAVAGATGHVRVTMLGASMPAEQLHRRLSVGDIDVLALSCSMPTNLIGAARCIRAAHDAGVPVVVGGRALGGTPHRARAIGADSWAEDARMLAGAPPALVGQSREIPAEVMLLDSVDDALIALTYERMLSAFPGLVNMTSYQHARTREDLTWIVRHTAGALLTDDPSIVEDLLTWLCERLRGIVPAAVITATAQLLADALEPQTPAGAAMLRRATRQSDLARRDLESAAHLNDAGQQGPASRDAGNSRQGV